MGVDLRILVSSNTRIVQDMPTCAEIEIGRDYQVHERLDKVARTIPGIKVYSYFRDVEVTLNPYGQPLTFVSAGEFLDAADGSTDSTVMAAAAYVNALMGNSPDRLIALYYH